MGGILRFSFGLSNPGRAGMLDRGRARAGVVNSGVDTLGMDYQ
jgi:hypothetical protein